MTLSSKDFLSLSPVRLDLTSSPPSLHRKESIISLVPIKIDLTGSFSPTTIPDKAENIEVHHDIVALDLTISFSDNDDEDDDDDEDDTGEIGMRLCY